MRVTAVGISGAVRRGPGGQPEGLDHRRQVRAGGRLRDADLHRVVAVGPQVHAALPSGRDDLLRAARDPDPDGVEEQLVLDLDATGLERGGQPQRVAADPLGDRLQPVRAVVHGVHRGHDGQQHLRGADVGGRLLPADVLLTGLQREPEGRGAGGIVGDPDQPAGELPLQLRTDRDEPRVRAAEPERHAESLRRSDRDVRADLARRAQQRQGQQVGGDDDLRLPLVRGLDQLGVITNRAGRARVGQQQPEEVTDRQRLGAQRQVRDDDLDADRLGAGLDDRDGLRQRVGVDDEPAGLGLRGPLDQRHRLGGRGGLVEHGRVGDLQRGEVGDRGLEVQQRLQPALGDLRLVRRVGRVPGRVLQHVALDHRRHEGVVVAHPDHLDHRGVACGQRPQLGERLGLGGGRRKFERAGLTDDRRHRGELEFVQARLVQQVQHRGQAGSVEADVPVGEGRRCGAAVDRRRTRRRSTGAAAVVWSVPMVSTSCPGAPGSPRPRWGPPRTDDECRTGRTRPPPLSSEPESFTAGAVCPFGEATDRRTRPSALFPEVSVPCGSVA